jgi:hypothetical protein
MQDPKTKLTIFHDDNSVFADHSEAMLDYGRDIASVELVSAEDRFYIGFEKPINTFYVELSVANTNANTFTAEYYNGTAFTALAKFKDDSLGFTRSGFMRWDRNQTDEVVNTINGTELFWYRFTPSADHSVGTALAGINLVFADDEDLRGEIPEIAQFRNSGESSFILVHQAARNDIIQELRNKGRLKSKSVSSSTLRQLQNIDQWDLLDKMEVRSSAKYLALSKIFFNLSDRLDDKHYQRSLDYNNKFKEAFDLYWLSLDLDDDGIVDNSERLITQRTVVTRV